MQVLKKWSEKNGKNSDFLQTLEIIFFKDAEYAVNVKKIEEFYLKHFAEGDKKLSSGKMYNFKKYLSGH